MAAPGALAQKQGDKLPNAPNLPNSLHSAPPAFTARDYNPAWETDGLGARNQPQTLAQTQCGAGDEKFKDRKYHFSAVGRDDQRAFRA